MKKRGVFREFTLLVSIVFLSILAVSFVFAASSSEPEGPDTIDISDSGRRTLSASPVIIDAEAGNVTAMDITHTRVTEAWQGYYGNVTGTITLDDANNVTFYDWALPDPTGEIYASNGSSVTWSDVYCMNLSHTRPNDGSTGSGFESTIYYNINMSIIETNFGINNTDTGALSNDLDGLNETFNDTYTSTVGFMVGEIHINGTDGCSLAHPFSNENHNTDWNEILLTDNESMIFTALFRENKNMYKTDGTETADFQLLVLENGHVGSEDSTTPYYFYVELS